MSDASASASAPEGPIAALRRRIDALDEELVRVLDDRARVAAEIGRIKQGGGQAYYSPTREREVIARVRALSSGAFPRPALEVIFREVMSASRALLAPTRVAFLGAPGGVAHLAARLRFGTSSQYEPIATPAALLGAVESSNADYGVFSVEALPDAPAFDALDLFLGSDAHIFGEFVLDRGHCLLARATTMEVRTVYAHPGSLALCQRWVSARLEGTRFEAAATGMDAARRAAAEEGAAALGMEILADVEGLAVLERGLEDIPVRRRFFLLSLREPPRSDREKTSFLFVLRYVPGSLADLLARFAAEGLNIAWIEIRTSHKHPWQHVFLMEFEGHRTDAAMQRVLAVLPPQVEFMRILGSYPAEA
jgi:chorismate mutase/prephenate dehydratase